MTDLQQFRKLMLENDIHADQGTWDGAPALAASTVDMVNNSGGPVTVFISAGTVTVVKVGGVTTGLTTPATVRVRDNEALNITYSVAPTLKWFTN
jgi:hypothetical protein